MKPDKRNFQRPGPPEDTGSTRPGPADREGPSPAPSRRLRFEDEDTGQTGASGHDGPKSKSGKFQEDSRKARPSDRMRQEDDRGGPQDTGKAQEPEGSAEKAGSKKDKYQKAQAKAERAGEKLGKAREKLDKVEAKRAAQKPPGLAKKAVRGARTEAWFYLHNKIHEVEHENVGVEGAHKSELTAEAGTRKLTRYAKRRWREHPARKVAKWERKNIKARANVDFQKMAAEHPELASNPLSRIQQKWKLKRRYSKEAKAAAKQSAKAAKKAAAASGNVTRRAAQFVTRHPVAVLVLVLLLLVCYLLSAVSSIFPTLGSGLANAVSGTSYASEDADLLGVDEDYTALENELAQTVANIESTHPGYDEYRYSVDEIGHNPYELTLTEEIEIRYRTETSTDPETGETTTEEVPYEYYILNVTLTNKTLPAVILPRLDEQQREIYTVMQQLKGNKPYLWEGIYTGGEDTGPSYEIPGEALDDPAFAALMAEATKYIGWPYVWGGSSPSTSFDCSGFVCWVYTASGVHNLPRTTAQGIYNQCAIISPSEAKPGDIIFFTGTYDSPGPVSHVGIYVGDEMMLHCGSPIQYANINSSYWQTHFYAFGRL
ncbi:NlpC/P60 family protein [[Clostridium] innocuum]|nr:C40 family peptidase [[Clostridium] innocuum]MCI2997180.1 NlpC/P60 family protein [[Clostridium] innocuum]